MKSNGFQIFFWLLIHLYCTSLLAQYSYSDYGQDEGLSQVTVTSIIKSKNGFLWVGTRDGLNRFDGHKFKQYFNIPDDEHSICGNRIKQLYEDNQTRLWVLTVNNGACFFDSKTEKFYPLEGQDFSATTAEGIIQDTVTNLVWVGLENKIVAISKSNKIQKQITHPDWKQHRVNNIFIGYNNSILVSTESGRIYEIVDNKPQLRINNAKWGVITGIIKANKGYLLSSHKGLFSIAKNLSSYKACGIGTQMIYEIPIYSIQKKKSSVWITTDNGIYQLKDFDTTNYQYKIANHFNEEASQNALKLSNNSVYYQFHEKNKMWFGTANRLALFESNNPVFNSYQSNTTSDFFYEDEVVFSITKTNNQTLLSGTSGKGLHIYNKNKSQFVPKGITQNDLPGDVVRSVVSDENYYWIGTTEGIAIVDKLKFDQGIYVFKHLLHISDKNVTAPAEKNLRKLYLDKNKKLWVTTYGGGINLINTTHNDSYNIKNFNRENSQLPSNYTYGITQDFKERIWIGTRKGLSCFTKQKDTYKVTNYNTSNSNIASNIIYDIVEDGNKGLWLGTVNGLAYYHFENKTFKNYGLECGLRNGVIYAVLVADSSHIWVSTNKGISKFDTRIKKFTNYTKKDGLPAEEFCLLSKFKDIDGKLYFGSINGIVSFHPKEIHQLDQTGTLGFTNLYLQGKEVNTGNGFLKKSIYNSENLSINYSQFPLELEFTDFNFRSIKNNTFKYRILPNNKEWTNLGEQKKLSLVSLNKGKHRLEIQGYSRGKAWNVPPLSIELTIVPHWSRSNLAFIIYGLLLCGVIFMVYKYHLNQKLAKLRLTKVEEVSRLKNTFYTNITHEFRTPLTVILGLSKELEKKIPSYKTQLQTIHRNGSQLLKLINQILTLKKIEEKLQELNLVQIDVIAYLKQIIFDFEQLASSREINFTFYTSEKEVFMDVDVDKLEAIINNLLSNAIKFTFKKGQILLQAEQINNLLQITIKDTGIGIAQEEQKKVFERFYQAENTFKNNSGTGIGLSICKEFITLMHGDIQLKSKKNKGTTITFQLPITCKAEITNLSANKNLDVIPSNLEGNLLQSASILIVEDNEDIITYLKSCLHDRYKIFIALNGEQGIEEAKKQLPDAIITDIIMPKVNGLELCKYLKSNQLTQHIPIIALTAKVSDEERLEGLKSGADIYLNKPFLKTELLLHIENLLSRYALLKEKYTKPSFIFNKNKDLKPTEDIFIEKLISCIKENISNSNFKTIFLAKEIGISESQLYRKVKAITGKSTSGFIRYIRLLKAQQLLKEGELNISEITYLTGFNDPSWFSRAFKEEFGTPPNEWRNTL